nr:hypothetical protein [Oceanococcus sp. HetDA_MAG_MS8]
MGAYSQVLRLSDLDSENRRCLEQLLQQHGLQLHELAPDQAIPGSFWGDDEAGLIADVVYARPDTPVHSIFHESCHAICMDGSRRQQLHTDAGGDDAEECAVCYLQIVLADALPGMGRDRMCADMDAWGYSFRLGSARAWFDHDASDALEWLRQRQIPTCVAPHNSTA